MLTALLQPTHLLILLGIALLFLGPKRLPEADRAIGQGLKEFRSSIAGDHEHPHVTDTADQDAMPPVS